jgi:general nucleoside transport system permease protein
VTAQIDVIEAPPDLGQPGGKQKPFGRALDLLRRVTDNIVALYTLSILVALLITLLLVMLVGGSPLGAIEAFYRGSISNSSAVSETIAAAVPVLIVAIGTLASVRAGMFNIGQGGQMELGAMCAAFVALKLHGPAPLLLAASIAAGVLGGALWAAIAGALKFTRNVDVVISTLLLGYVANEILTFAVNHVSWLEYSYHGQGESSYSAALPAKLHLPLFGSANGFGVNLGLFIGLAVFALVTLLIQRGTWGFRLRIAGQNQAVGRHLGIRMWAVAGAALVLSGALAGLAGGVLLTGSVFRVQAGFNNGIPTQGLLAALVVRDRPLLLLPICLFFGMIQTGGDALLSTGVPFYLGQILQALLVFAAVFPAVYKQRQAWWRDLRRAQVLGLPPLEDA